MNIEESSDNIVSYTEKHTHNDLQKAIKLFLKGR